jgi:hypothetical protein
MQLLSVPLSVTLLRSPAAHYKFLLINIFLIAISVELATFLFALCGQQQQESDPRHNIVG